MPKPLFNSLGSNYSADLVEESRRFISEPYANQAKLEAELKERLGNHFNGDVILTYKGRDAIELALRPLVNVKAQQAVITQGLACHAIEEGIIRAGMIPIYVDLEKDTLGPSVKTIEAGYRRAQDLGVVVAAVFLQHTLGYANPSTEIAEWCRSHDVVLISDLAQSFGAMSHDGIELGMNTDVVICSFGRDKVLDAVSGGAVIYTQSYWEFVTGEKSDWLAQCTPEECPPVSAVKKEMIYPALTQFIRLYHQSGIGKIAFKLAKSIGLMTSPISTAVEHPTSLPAGYIKMVLWQLDHVEQQLQHRRQIAEVFAQKLSTQKNLRCYVEPKRLNTDIHLRVPVLCESSEQLQRILSACTSQNVHLTDRWYRAVVDSGSLNYPTLYQPGSCPVAESVAERLLNLPTHIHITPEDAERIADIIVEQL